MKKLNLFKSQIMMPLTNKKTKLIIKSMLPSTKEMLFVAKAFFVLSIIFTFFYLFQYSGYQLNANAQSEAPGQGQEDITSGVLNHFTNAFNPTMIGCGGSAISKTAGGADQTSNILCSTYNPANTNQKSSFLTPIDMGATGRIINSTSYFIDQPIAQPGETVQYYASRVKGTAYAASGNASVSGREVLAPIFMLSNLMKNIAYGLIVIVLVISSMSILIGYLSGTDQKLSLVQLMINCGVALLFITFFYELSAIIYDVTVNYGNAFVASVMEPYINARFILERLQPGGDLNATALLNAYQFSGVSEGLITVANNVFMGLAPAISNTIDAFTSNIANDLPLGIGKLAGFLNGLAGSAVTFGATTMISSLLGSQAVFNCIIAFVFFTINFKIWVNLLIAFISFNLYVAFGPLMMLGAVNKGYDEIKNVFKTLFAFGLIFPVTFLFIMLGATVMNFFVRSGPVTAENSASGTENSALCVYSTQDPTGKELENAFKTHTFGKITGVGADGDPRAFKRNWTDFQDIYEVQAENNNGLRNCRSKLFPTPFTFLPAPLGNYGNRLLQIQTTDSMIRTFIAVAFIVLAVRAPQMINELLGVKPMSFTQNLGGVFANSVSSVLGVAGLGLGAAPKIALGGLKFIGTRQTGFLGKLETPIRDNIGNAVKKLGPKPGKSASLFDLARATGGGYNADLALSKAANRAQMLSDASTRAGGPIGGTGAATGGAGMSDLELAIFKGNYLAQNFDRLAGSTSILSEAFTGLGGAFTTLQAQIIELGNNIQKLAGLSAISSEI